MTRDTIYNLNTGFIFFDASQASQGLPSFLRFQLDPSIMLLCEWLITSIFVLTATAAVCPSNYLATPSPDVKNQTICCPAPNAPAMACNISTVNTQGAVITCVGESATCSPF